MGEHLLRIGETASRAGVSRRTVDFYTGMGLLTPVRTSANFRLYQEADVRRIASIRRLEAQGIRLDEITHLLTTGDPESGTEPADAPPGPSAGPAVSPGPASPVALEEHLISLDEQVRALRNLPEVADRGTRGVLATLVTRAQMLIATAVVLSEELLPGSDLLPPL